jgi:GH24 family phage-related lysozyme (muramidase)
MKKLIILLLVYSLNLHSTPETGRAKRIIQSKTEIDTLYNYSIETIKRYEGYRKRSYKIFKHTCIGYGELKKYVNEDSLSLSQADSVLRRHFDNDIKSVKLLIRTRDQRTILTLAMFSYNCGIGTLKKSKLLKLVNSRAEAGEIERIYMQYTFANGKYLTGLAKRRKSEFLIK